ncbi:YhdT family protein [Metabacillus sp. Hm71]|uniref:YhdT family protein n=1 Tax=Metabacillus sp. Hm71 TaxID=3450743 RepID=UPI003F44301C
MEDKRFKIAHREAIIGIILVLINFAIWYGFAYGLGDQDPMTYAYILGFPAWFFYSCIAGTIFMIVSIAIVMKFFFTEVSLEEEEEE